MVYARVADLGVRLLAARIRSTGLPRIVPVDIPAGERAAEVLVLASFLFFFL